MKRPYRIACIGGGTGLPVVLRGLREYRQHKRPAWERIDLSGVTPIVSFSDDGGSSGRLVEQYGTLPPGDLRNCLLALADPRIEPLMTQFFNHRFSAAEGEALAGHSAGNLLILALSQLHEGDVRQAILDARRLLGIEGKIVFPTLAPAVLCAELSDGSVVVGESSIANRTSPYPISRVFLACRDDPAPHAGGNPPALPATPEALQAIGEADGIVLGPGSLYSSVIANLLVPEVADAVRKARGTKIYVANLMIEPGETDDFSLAQHLEALRQHGDIEVDFVVANDTPVDPIYARLYALERLQREIELVQRSLEEASAAGGNGSAEGIDAAAVEHRMARIRGLVDDVGQPEADRGQVLVRCGEERLCGARVVGIDAIRVEQLPAQDQVKRVLRHDPEKLVGAILGILGGVK